MPAVCPLLMFQGPLQLFSWTDSLAGATSLSNTPVGAAIHACSDLAQLAMWLGVGKVRGDHLQGEGTGCGLRAKCIADEACCCCVNKYWA
jgi:hypothetical protein